MCHMKLKIQLSWREEGKAQESIQSSTTLDPGHHMGKLQKHKETSHTRDPRGQHFPCRGMLYMEHTRHHNNMKHKLIKQRMIHKRAPCLIIEHNKLVNLNRGPPKDRLLTITFKPSH